VQKIFVIIGLLTVYFLYSGWVYTNGTELKMSMDSRSIQGKSLWQEKNCQNCHQLFGLGGYMGPDLTTVTTDPKRGTAYAKGILMSGGSRMPNFHFKEEEADALVAYLDYVNKAAENHPE
jgi:nitric oxide reductase subunit C